MDPRFFTANHLARAQTDQFESPRGTLLMASNRSGAELAASVVARYQHLLKEAGEVGTIPYLPDIDVRFSDSETDVRLARDVGGCDVFLFQSLYDPRSERGVDENYMAALIATRAFREWGANHVTSVQPYLAYARQDKPTEFTHEPTTAKLMADLSITAGLDRLVTWHPHSRQLHGFYGQVPIHPLEPLTFFVQEFKRFRDRADVVAIAPDAGAVNLVMALARTLNLTSAVASKYRPRPEEAEIAELVGDLHGKRIALVLDDMISTGGTVYALIRKLAKDKGIDQVYLAASHSLCSKAALERLRELHDRYGLQEVIVTNSIPQTEAFRTLPFVRVRDLSDILARVVNRIHHNRPISELFQVELARTPA